MFIIITSTSKSCYITTLLCGDKQISLLCCNSRTGSTACRSPVCPHWAKIHLISAVRGMTSLCYGNITRAVVSGVSVTLCGPCREACCWPDTKPRGSVTHHSPGVMRTKIVLKEINSSNQRSIHTFLTGRYQSTHTEDTHSQTLQSFPGNVNI